jgi:hypothetical protein
LDAGAVVQVQKYLQDRPIQRKAYENRGKKIAAREEIDADPEKLWIIEQAKRWYEKLYRIAMSQY